MTHILTLVIKMDDQPEALQRLNEIVNHLPHMLMEDWGGSVAGEERDDGLLPPYVQRVEVARDGVVLAAAE
jgi:hypothetical protein